MYHNDIFSRLWKDYIPQNPSARPVFDLFRAEGETVINDHIAFRTFSDPVIGVDKLAQVFLKNGYEFRFTGGEFEIPGCYYEFAKRYPDSDGKLYSGFIAKSADKIFESTNFYKK